LCEQRFAAQPVQAQGAIAQKNATIMAVFPCPRTNKGGHPLSLAQRFAAQPVQAQGASQRFTPEQCGLRSV